MLDDPDGTLSILRESVAQFAKHHDGVRALRDKRRSGDDLDRGLWSAMAHAGWTGLLLPEDVGGGGLGVREQAVLSEALGRSLVSEPLATLSVFAGALLASARSSTERDKLSAGIVSGETITAPAWLDGKRPTLAVLEADAVVLDGEKQFVDGARSASSFLVVAVANTGAAVLSVPADTPGVSISDRPGIDGASIATVRFSACRLPTSCVLAQAEDCEALLALPHHVARIALAAELAGIASGALERTVAYAKERVQFGKPIGSFQSIQHRLVEMWMDAELACAAVVNAVEAADSGESRAARLAGLAAKARAGDAAVSICRRAVHLYGAMGFTDECDIGLYLKRAINLNAMLGQPEQLRLQFIDLERAA
jgi:alkylation response protein AidB-like acyl-CoA dehydrogenase